MDKKSEVQLFLTVFKQKMKVWDVLFLNRDKNIETLAALEITAKFREHVLLDLSYEDYCQGPLQEAFYGSSEMWVFGKIIRNKEVYIKITLGKEGTSVICISFHLSDYPLKYPFK
ncbi:MAG TPA: hypothetical protein VFF21_01555 [Flavobacteriaceae bacterium]|nr:hypothetical protein [Flavobacteriaceae bacterium]